MQSAGLRRGTRASMAPSVDETASVVTLHTIPDSTITPASKSKRTTFVPPKSQAPSSNPSLIIQHPDETSRPATAEKRKQAPRSKKRTQTRRKNFALENPKSELVTEIDSSLEDEEEDSDLDEPDVTPPKFTIDLSKPPAERYNHVAAHFTPNKIILEKLFRQIVKETVGWDTEKARKWGRWVFRKLPSAEEEEELQGIAHVWGVEKFLLVAFNLLLDSFMGCTSGGARVRDPASPTSTKADTPDNTQLVDLWDSNDSRGTMLHFRTLDWQMEDLRKLVCQYEYIAYAGGEVIARQVTYFGFVGVLTGVRQGLSISLNFRPCHDKSSWWKNLCFRTHQILVLLGWRQSISSILRECLLPGKYQPLRKLPTLVDVERDIPSKKTTAAYLIFSDGSRTTTMELDHRTATVRSASDFIIALNHDVADETQAVTEQTPVETMEADPQRERVAHDMLSAVGMEGLVACSIDRKKCVADHWRDARSLRGGTAVQTEDVIQWMKDPEISNDETHYAVIMDPTKGEFVWLRRWLRPLEEHDPR